MGQVQKFEPTRNLGFRRFFVSIFCDFGTQWIVPDIVNSSERGLLQSGAMCTSGLITILVLPRGECVKHPTGSLFVFTLQLVAKSELLNSCCNAFLISFVCDISAVDCRSRAGHACAESPGQPAEHTPA